MGSNRLVKAGTSFFYIYYTPFKTICQVFYWQTKAKYVIISTVPKLDYSGGNRVFLRSRYKFCFADKRSAIFMRLFWSRIKSTKLPFPLIPLACGLHKQTDYIGREDDRHGNTLCSSGYHSFISLCCDLRNHKRDNKEYTQKITAVLPKLNGYFYVY